MVQTHSVPRLLSEDNCPIVPDSLVCVRSRLVRLVSRPICSHTDPEMLLSLKLSFESVVSGAICSHRVPVSAAPPKSLHKQSIVLQE